MKRLQTFRDDERGTVVLLIVGYAMIALFAIFVVIGATSLYQERQRLFTVADGAALVGAEAFELHEVALAQSGIRPVLKSENVEREVEWYLKSVPTEHLEELMLEAAYTEDGQSATVRLSSYWRPPIVAIFIPEGIRLEVTARSRSVFS